MQTIKNVFIDEFASIRLPREIVIKDTRLGILYKVLQISAVVLVLVYITYTEIWYETFVPDEYGLVVWNEQPLTDANISQVRHCIDPKWYWYNYSAEFTYQPTSCQRLPNGEAVTKGGNELYLVTFAQDTLVWQSFGDYCTSEMRSRCLNNGVEGFPQWESTTRGDCSCTLTLEYFSRNAELQRIAFEHGYKTQTDYQSSYMSGSTSTGEVTWTVRGRRSTRQGDILTILLKEDGSRCQVGGRSEYIRSETGPSITGTLGEWLSCAGVTLDTNPDTMVSSTNNAPQLRTMGMNLVFEMEYMNRHSYDHNGVVCLLKVVVLPKWTSQTSRDVSHLRQISGQQAGRFRYSYGVQVSAEVKGTMKFFNMEKFANGVIAALVIFTVPRIIFEFVTLYCLGSISEVYRCAKKVPFNLYTQLHQVISRMMVSQAAFGLMCNRGNTLDATRVKDLLEMMFERELADETLSRHEFNNIVEVVMTSLMNEDGEITVDRFLAACTSNDLIRMQPLIKVLSHTEKRSVVAKLLDSTTSNMNKLPGISEEVQALQAQTTRICEDASEIATAASRKFGMGVALGQAEEKAVPRTNQTGNGQDRDSDSREEEVLTLVEALASETRLAVEKPRPVGSEKDGNGIEQIPQAWDQPGAMPPEEPHIVSPSEAGFSSPPGPRHSKIRNSAQGDSPAPPAETDPDVLVIR